MMEELNTLAKRLVFARKQAGLRQDEVADYIGKTSVAYGHYERGRNEPMRETAIKICELLKIRLDWLMTGEGPQTAVEEKQIDLSILEAGLQETVQQAYEDAKSKQIENKIKQNQPLSDWELKMLQDRLRGKK